MSSNKPQWMKLCAIAAAILLGAYVVLSPPVAWPMYSAILFRPNNNKHDDALQLIKTKFGITPKYVRFPSANGKMLRGCYFELPESSKVVLFSSGKGGNMSLRFSNAAMLLHCGFSVMMYDYQGYGESEGTPSLERTCEDAVAAYDYLIEQEQKSGENIIAFGDSFGCGPTGQLCRRRTVSAVILESGYSSLLRASRDTLPWLRLYPDDWFPEQMMDNVAIFSKPHPPLLIIHGTSDKALPFQNALDLFSQALEPKQLLAVKNGPHGSVGTSDQFQNAVNCLLVEISKRKK